jgi:vacuolar-type H+-ATPase subunit I/STV1
MFAGLGLLLLIAGAIVTFAVERESDNVDLQALGWILMIAGAVSMLIGLITWSAWWGSRKTRALHEVHVTPDGGMIEETRID